MKADRKADNKSAALIEAQQGVSAQCSDSLSYPKLQINNGMKN